MKHIFLHGLGQTSSSWNDVVEFIENKSDTLCPDLCSLFGNNEINYQNLYKAFSAYCMEISEPLSICGLSLGGILALQYGIEHSDKVNSMVLIGTQYVMPKKLLHFQNLIFRFMPNSAFKGMGFGKNDFINLSKSMMSLDFQNSLQNLTCPVLVICGEKDGANKQAALQLKEKLPLAELSIIAKAGHEVNTEAPKQLGNEINSFFQKTM